MKRILAGKRLLSLYLDQFENALVIYKKLSRKNSTMIFPSILVLLVIYFYALYVQRKNFL